MNKILNKLSKFGYQNIYTKHIEVKNGDIFSFDNNFISVLNLYLLSSTSLVLTKSQHKNINLYLSYLDGCMSPTDVNFKVFRAFDLQIMNKTSTIYFYKDCSDVKLSCADDEATESEEVDNTTNKPTIIIGYEPENIGKTVTITVPDKDIIYTTTALIYLQIPI